MVISNINSNIVQQSIYRLALENLDCFSQLNNAINISYAFTKA